MGIQPYVQPLLTREGRVSHQFKKNGLRRGLAAALYYSVAIRLPGPGMPGGFIGHWLRTWLAKRMLRKCGRGIRVAPGARFGSGLVVSLGNNSNLGRDCWLLGDVSIGDDVVMAPEVIIITSNHAFFETAKPIIVQGQAEMEPVVIGDDVWIGTRVIILPGVRVGSHSIIGAGSVVTRDVPEWAIVAGNPARAIRSRVNTPLYDRGKKGS
jgi:maltose O-acetyltransferase